MKKDTKSLRGSNGMAALILTIIALILISPAGPAHATIVKLITESQQALGTEFRVDIVVDNVTDLYGLAADLLYDTQIIVVVTDNNVPPKNKVTEGVFLNKDGLDETFLRSALEDGIPGTLVLGLSRSGAVAGVNTSGDKVILSVYLKGLKAGTTYIAFSKPALKDSANDDIAVTEWNGVTIVFKEPTAVSVTPPSKDFGEVLVGSQSAPQTFTILNTGAISLTLNLTVLDASNFAIQNDNCSQVTLAPSQSCTADAVFSPLSTGQKSGNLSIASDDPNSGPLNVPLSGVGVSTLTVAVDPASTGRVTGTGIDCPGDCTETYRTSGATAQLTAVATATGYHFANWSGDASGSNNPITLAVDTNKSVTAQFALDTFTIMATAGPHGSISPSGAVTVQRGYNATFDITPDQGYHVAGVLVDSVSVGAVTSYTFTNVTGSHTIAASFDIDLIPDISITPPYHYFGIVRVGETSASQTFTVANFGNAPLVISTISITDTDASQFLKSSDSCSQRTIAPSETCEVDAQFAPTSEGFKYANLSINSNDPDTPSLIVYLNGLGGCVKADANYDGNVNILDAILTLRIILGTEPVPDDLCPVDMDNSGGVDVTDLIKVMIRSLEEAHHLSD